MTTITSLLVGMHFRPPASTILAHLPAGAKLILEPEPENPYDADALKVLVDPREIPESQFSQLDEVLPASGATLEQIMSSGPIWLGYVAKSGGKPLAKAGLTSGNREFVEGLCDPECETKLAFGPAGEALVKLIYGRGESND